jgi:hypothetical protein
MPSTFSGGSITLYYDLTYLKQREHRITLVALEENGADSMHRQEPSSYCDELIKIDMPPAGTWLKKYHIIRNMLSFVHLRSNSHTFLNPAYSPQMQLKINELVKNNKFDVIYV